MAPAVGLEPTTDRLTADCSTTELRRNKTDHSETRKERNSVLLEADAGIEPT